MINVQQEVQLLKEQRLHNAVQYIRLNPTLSFHHVAVKFKINVSDLQNSYKDKVNGNQ